MSEKYTVLDIPAVRHGGMGEYGTVEPEVMLADCRRMYEQQLEDARAALVELDAGRYEVHQQTGIHAAKNRKRVYPPGDAGQGKPFVPTHLVTVECSRPGERYTLLESGPGLIVHLAGETERGGTGPCICGFDRFGSKVGFSVGGGVSGPGVEHEVCADCARLVNGRPVNGLHARLFVEAGQDKENR